MATRTSLQKTLGIGLTLGVTLLWLLGVTASGLVAQHEMNEVFDSALEETAQRILPLAVTDILNRENGSGNQIAPAMKDHDEYLTYLVRNKQGNILLRPTTPILRFWYNTQRGIFIHADPSTIWRVGGQ